MDFQRYDTPGGSAWGIECRLNEIAQWHPTVGQARDHLLAGMVISGQALGPVLPDEAMQFLPRQREVETLSQMTQRAAAQGRLFDFGYLPNSVIMPTGKRAGPLYLRGAIGHPFAAPWLLFHTWEQETALYLINPMEPDCLAGGAFEIAELNPISIKDRHFAFMVGDRAILQPGEAEIGIWSRYPCQCAPSPWRYMPGAETINQGHNPAHAAAGNVLDPVVTALLILSTNGIKRETIAPSAALAKARAKSGKPPIPSYQRVDGGQYVTAIDARLARADAETKGGTHASPAPHLRRGHIRVHASGTQTFIRDTLVNVTEQTRAAFVSRSHYVVKPGT